MTAGEGAGEGFLSCVDPDVVCEEPGPGEGLVAVVALEVPVVGLHVHCQGGHGGVVLVADRAVTSLLSVDLPVSGEVAAGGEVLATVLAALQLVASGGLGLSLPVHCEAHLQAGAGVLGVLRYGGGGRGCPGGGETQVESLVLLVEGRPELQDGVSCHDVLDSPGVHGVVLPGVLSSDY